MVLFLEARCLHDANTVQRWIGEKATPVRRTWSGRPVDLRRSTSGRNVGVSNPDRLPHRRHATRASGAVKQAAETCRVVGRFAEGSPHSTFTAGRSEMTDQLANPPTLPAAPMTNACCRTVKD